MRSFFRFFLVSLILLSLFSCYSTRAIKEELSDIREGQRLLAKEHFQTQKKIEEFRDQYSQLRNQDYWLATCQNAELYLALMLDLENVVHRVSYGCLQPKTQSLFAQYLPVYEKAGHLVTATEMMQVLGRHEDAIQLWKSIYAGEKVAVSLDMIYIPKEQYHFESIGDEEDSHYVSHQDRIEEIRKAAVQSLQKYGLTVVEDKKDATMDLKVAFEWPENYPKNLCYLNRFRSSGTYKGQKFQYQNQGYAFRSESCELYTEQFITGLVKYWFRNRPSSQE